MEKILSFLGDNWQVFSVGLVVLVDTILLLFRRNKVIDNSFIHEIYDLLIDAEINYGKGHGSEKLKYVLNNFDFKLHPYATESLIKKTVEYLLAGPTKKGGFGREE